MLCGYSMGGRLALHAALRDPGRYRGVVTIGASAGIEEPVARSARAEADERLAGWMETMPIAEIVSVWERQPLFADQGDALVEAQREGRLSHDPRELALLLRTAGQGDARPGLARARDAAAAAAGARGRPRRALRARRRADGRHRARGALRARRARRPRGPPPAPEDVARLSRSSPA